MGKFKGFFISILLVIFSSNLQAQKLKLDGYFLQDSAKLGERVGYVLKAEYPSEMNIVFPDSTFNYQDFAFLEKQTFTSYTPDSVTLDSAIYYLSNFSLDPVKSYSLPVFEILKYDSIQHSPIEDNLNLELTIKPMPEELTFKDNDKYQAIPKEFNYPYLLMFLGILLIVIIGSILLFGNKFQKEWAIRKIKKKHKKFLGKWTSAVQTLQSNPSLQVADETLWLWKDYMEELTGKPYREWTATEIGAFMELPDLVNDFRKIEIIIYANRTSEDLLATCDKLKSVCEDMYHQKIKEIHESK
ncbi:hypothetical protein [Echinicola salinicaeni]|uniref:hypothetical protein n=1 Tax=Echinicola salinicaeni TaxID=2762757 RepID=UPI0016494D98|nr:hypothetical protein [Echinicola salinicaeni]